MTHLVEEVQLETGYISISQLLRIVQTTQATNASVSSSSAANLKDNLTMTRAEATRVLHKWGERCLTSGASRWDVGIELEEIRRQASLDQRRDFVYEISGYSLTFVLSFLDHLFYRSVPTWMLSLTRFWPPCPCPRARSTRKHTVSLLFLDSSCRLSRATQISTLR